MPGEVLEEDSSVCCELLRHSSILSLLCLLLPHVLLDTVSVFLRSNFEVVSGVENWSTPIIGRPQQCFSLKRQRRSCLVKLVFPSCVYPTMDEKICRGFIGFSLPWAPRACHAEGHPCQKLGRGADVFPQHPSAQLVCMVTLGGLPICLVIICGISCTQRFCKCE